MYVNSLPERASLWDDAEAAGQSPHAVLFAFATDMRDRLAEGIGLPTQPDVGASARARDRLSRGLGIEVTAGGFRLLAGPIAYAQLVDGEPLGDAALHQLITGWLALLP